jgi:hypothetical protein
VFWFVSNGVTDPEGAALMPAFESMLSETDRWALIDFIHARNIGIQANRTGQWSPPVRVPDTPLNCDGEETATLADLGHDVLVVADAAPAVIPARIGPGSVPGVDWVRLVRDAAASPGEGECVSEAAAAWEAWRVLSGIAPDRFGGYQALVDGQGWLRAWLPPGDDSDQVTAAVRDAHARPIPVGARTAAAHHH